MYLMLIIVFYIIKLLITSKVKLQEINIYKFNNVV